MAIIKVSTSIFSPVKTIEKAIQKADSGDEIQVAPGHYKESIQFYEDVLVVGKEQEKVIIEGIIIIPNSVKVTFENVYFCPTAQIYIEGHSIFKNCTFKGDNTSAILSVNQGQLELEECLVTKAKDIGIALFNRSEASISNCTFGHNGKAHILLEASTIVVENSEFSNADHGFWMKENATVKSNNNRLHHQLGTQVIVQTRSTFHDIGSTIEHGQGNGLYVTNSSQITLRGTFLQHHPLPQIWLQDSECIASNCTIHYGKESGIMLQEHATADLQHCIIAYHQLANIQLTTASRINTVDTQIHSCEGIGVQLREKSIATFTETVFAANILSQLLVTENSIASLKDCEIKEGKQVGILIKSLGSCTAVQTKILNHVNSAITVMDGELTLLESEISQNQGNGILATSNAEILVEYCTLWANDMPHIAGKAGAIITINHCDLHTGKSFYIIDHSKLYINHSTIHDSSGIQIEITNGTEAHLKNCKIYNGTSNGIKASRNSSLHVYNSQISHHKMPQIAINDSSLIFKGSELLDGARNGFIIENNSEAYIKESFISNHLYPQIWIDLKSNVELFSTQLTKGSESDIYVQNNSTTIANNCIIRNDKFALNIQAVNYSKILLQETIIENPIGDKFYSENNSTITNSLDEVNGE
ncbi:right-handed parallel beta-helix repeat-containing protein [Lysinibacillus sp. 54212]|uniref:right-handed parallel beta-helix repeat-containing protein n=1 Tax=Lysinibacillus sp. 54212 TaxID=3119829 RepID=UPI002FCCAFB2